MIKPMFRYKAACTSLENGEYAAAIEEFTALGDYKDAPVQLQEANYSLACSMLEKGNYSEAAQAFTAIRDYKDSGDRINECNYQLALEPFNNKDYEQALELLNICDPYKDSGDRINECNYQLALESFDNKDYEQALERLRICDSFKDAPRYAQMSNIYILARDHKDELLSEAETDQLTADDLSLYSDFCLDAAKRNEESCNLTTALKLYAECPSDEMNGFLERTEFPISIRGFGGNPDTIDTFDFDSGHVINDAGETYSLGCKIGTDGQVTFICHLDTNKAYRMEFAFLDWTEDYTTYDFYKIGGTPMESNQSASYAIPYADIAEHQEISISFYDRPEKDTGYVFDMKVYCNDVTEMYELVQECMAK